MYAKFGDDPLWNDKALADRKSDNTNKKNKNKNNVTLVAIGDPFRGPEYSWTPAGMISCYASGYHTRSGDHQRSRHRPPASLSEVTDRRRARTCCWSSVSLACVWFPLRVRDARLDLGHIVRWYYGSRATADRGNEVGGTAAVVGDEHDLKVKKQQPRTHSCVQQRS